MQRRRFLHLASGVAAFIGGVTAPSFSARSREKPSKSRNPKAPKPANTNVLVIGGGPAGMSAALELAERGIQVTLIEAGEQLGGKVKAWKETLAGEEVPVEHGIHGWWYQYVHFSDLLNRYNLDGSIRPFTDEETGIRTPKGMINSKFRLLEAVIDRIRKTGYRKEIRNWVDGFAADSLALPSKLYERIGGKSVTQWIREGAPISVYTTFSEMLSWSMYFLSPKELDAATFALGERFYFNGSVNKDRVGGWILILKKRSGSLFQKH